MLTGLALSRYSRSEALLSFPLKRGKLITMLDNQGFNKWAPNYDRNVAADDVAGENPFAGYTENFSEIRTLIKILAVVQ